MAGLRFDKIFNEKKELHLVEGPQLIQSELQFLLTINKHTLFFGNDIGIDLERYLHLLNTRATFNLIKSDIEELLIKYGKVYLQKIEMGFNKQKDILNITISVSESSSGRRTIDIPIEIGG